MRKYLLLFSSLAAAAFLTFPAAAQDAAAEQQQRETMIAVEGGSYLQGSAEGPYAANERVHRTTVSSFRIAPTETTQELYRSVAGKNPSFFKGDDRPVENVSWLDAVRFCNALSEKEGLQPAYRIEGASVEWQRDADGYRLPTEAEWEYAARGGVQGALGDDPLKKAPLSGGDPDAVAWFDRNSAKSTHPVAAKQPNQLGIYDMSGNVWEWCWDWYGPYPDDEAADPEGGPRGAGQKVLRGGAWFAPLNLNRVTYRYWSAPTFRVNSVGFRLARNAAPAPAPQVHESEPEPEPAVQVDFFEALAAPEKTDAR